MAVNFLPFFHKLEEVCNIAHERCMDLQGVSLHYSGGAWERVEEGAREYVVPPPSTTI